MKNILHSGSKWLAWRRHTNSAVFTRCCTTGCHGNLHFLLKCGNKRCHSLTSPTFTWFPSVILWNKQQRCAVSVICVRSPPIRAACGTPQQIYVAQSFSARCTASDGKDRRWGDASCGPRLLQTHLKYSHADKAQTHTGGTGNIYWSLKITRVSPVGGTAETLGSLQETELALNSKCVDWFPHPVNT